VEVAERVVGKILYVIMDFVGVRLVMIIATMIGLMAVK